MALCYVHAAIGMKWVLTQAAYIYSLTSLSQFLNPYNRTHQKGIWRIKFINKMKHWKQWHTGIAKKGRSKVAQQKHTEFAPSQEHMECIPIFKVISPKDIWDPFLQLLYNKQDREKLHRENWEMVSSPKAEEVLQDRMTSECHCLHLPYTWIARWGLYLGSLADFQGCCVFP